MNFILKTIQGDSFYVSEDEHKAIISAQPEQTIFLKGRGISIKKSMICVIYPKNSPDLVEKIKEQATGVLHDGGRVRRHFGQWILDDGFVPDDKGNYVPIKIDYNYYPEIVADCVATEDEYEKIRSENKNYYEFLRITEKVKRISGKFYSIKEIYDETNREINGKKELKSSGEILSKGLSNITPR